MENRYRIAISAIENTQNKGPDCGVPCCHFPVFHHQREREVDREAEYFEEKKYE